MTIKPPRTRPCISWLINDATHKHLIGRQWLEHHTRLHKHFLAEYSFGEQTKTTSTRAVPKRAVLIQPINEALHHTPNAAPKWFVLTAAVTSTMAKGSREQNAFVTTRTARNTILMTHDINDTIPIASKAASLQGRDE